MMTDMLSLIFLLNLMEYARGYVEHCNYLDVSQRSNSNTMDCGNKGCCGSFRDRYCCHGPIVPVVAVFGSIVGILLVSVVVALCYSSYLQRLRQRTQTMPLNTTEPYDIPLPSAPLPSPIYSSLRLYPSPRLFRPPNPAFREYHPPPVELSPPPLLLKYDSQI